MLSKWICIIGFALYTSCNSAFVDTLQKCSYKDGECVADLIHNVLNDISQDGVRDLDIPPIDPLNLNNTSIPIDGLLKFSWEHRQLKGIKDCVINNIKNNFDKGASDVDITCDLEAKAKFKLDELAPVVQNLLGSNATSVDGNAKVKLEKIRMKLNFFYHITKKDDGEAYVECHMDEFRYDFEIGNLKLDANKIFIGDQDISDLFVAFMNESWNKLLIMPSIAEELLDVVRKIFDDILHRFFKAVPIKYFLIDDVTPFIKN